MTELEYMMAPGIFSSEATYVDGVTNHVVYKDGKEYVTKLICCSHCKSQIDFTDNNITKTAFEDTKEIRESYSWSGYKSIHEDIERYLEGYVKCPKCKAFICVKRLWVRTVDSKLIYDAYQLKVEEDKREYYNRIRGNKRLREEFEEWENLNKQLRNLHTKQES